MPRAVDFVSALETALLAVIFCAPPKSLDFLAADVASLGVGSAGRLEHFNASCPLLPSCRSRLSRDMMLYVLEQYDEVGSSLGALLPMAFHGRGG